MDFLTRETPDGQTPFLNKITATMPKEEAERFEIALLDNILKHSRYLVVSGDKKVLDIVNSGEFLRRAGEIKGQFGAKAKDYIDLVSAWHKNFKNDAVLAHLTRNPASEPKVSTGLNPNLDARLKYVATATMFDGFFRLVPRIPFITDKFIGNDKIQAAALRYYLKKTLNESPSISALRRKLNFDLDKGNLPLNSQTRERLRQITNEVQKSEAQMDELAENLIKSSDENANLIQNLENSAQFGRDMFILGEENLNGDIVKWALQNNKRIAVNKLNTQKAQELGFKHPDDVRRTIGADEIRHTLSRHGENSELVKKSGQPPVNENDIANYQKISDNADETLKSLDNSGNLVEISFKQVNGYFVVVEQVRNKNNEFSFKTMFKGNGTYKNSEAYTKTAEKAQTLSQGYEPSANSFAQSADEIIPNSNSQSQAPQKSLLEQARENTERLRAAQEAEQIAQKEAELARLKEMQAKNAEIIAQKEAAAGQAINEAQSLEIGTPIKAQKISDTKIIINDNTAPFKAEFIIAKKDDIKPNFERTGTQGRSQRQDKVIESIQSDFKPHLIFEQMGGFEGLPIILKDGQVIAGNHRAQAIKGLTGENLTRYKQAAKEKFGIDLKDDEVIVRLVKDGDEKELINLAFMSNVGRESNIGEKALANLAKYESNMQNLPNHINADSVFELESQVAKALDTQGNGLNVFDTNLALFSRLAKNSSNTDILESLNTLKSLSQDEKEKVLRMFVSNAGEFHNLAKDTELKSLNLNDYLADALIVAAKNVDEKTRKANFQSLFNDIQTMLARAKEMLKIDPFLFENFKSKALGYAFARFARLENPAGKLFDFLKASKGDLENLYTGGLFDTNKAISDIDIYDFLKHAINSGDDLMDNGVNLKHAITSKLDDLRKVENALIDSGEIQFAKSKAKPQGREAKETSINSLFADDELQMQATKPAKELNLSDEKDFNELGEFFKLNLKDKEFNALYDKAAAAAQRLGVKVRFDESAGRSHFVLNDNTITIAAGNKELFQAQDLLHELIHATTRKALKDFSQSPEQAAKIYTKRQIEAIKEINSLYLKSKGIAKRQGKDAYALQNVDEFVAELSSGEFRAFLKAQDIFERFIKALIRFFTGDSEKLAKNVNSYKALKESYYKILDDYEPPLAPKSQSQLEFEMAQRQISELKARKNEILKELKTQDLNEAQRAQKTAQLENTKIEIENAYRQEKLKTQIGADNLTADIVKQTQTNKERIIIDELDKESAEKLGFENSDFVARSIDAQEIEHTLNRHGINSERAKNGEKPITYYDIAEYPQVTKTADEHLFGVTESGKPARVSFKQINGYYVVVEEVHNGQGELAFKSMYFSGGKYENGETYKKMIEINKNANSKNPLYLPRTKLGGSEIQADEKIIPNSSSQSQVEKEFLSPNGEDIFAKTTPEQRNQIVKGIQGEIDELVKASYEIDGKIKQIAKVANERAEITGRYSRTSDEIKAIDALNKESEKLEKEVYKLQTLQNFFKGDLSNDFWEFLHNFNNEKALKWYEKEINKRVKSVSGDESIARRRTDLPSSQSEVEKATSTNTQSNSSENLGKSQAEIQKVSHKVSHINQNNAIMSEISHKGGQDGTSNASNGLNAAEKGMPASEPAGISDGLFSQKQLLDEPRGAGADLSNSPTDRQQPQTLFSQGASEPNASGGQQRGSNERLRTASGDLRGEVSGDGQNLRAEKGHNVSERFKQDRSEQHSRAKHTIRANSSSGASHSNATATQELVSDTNAAGILSPAEKATIENQKFTQTIDPAKFNANEILSANINALKVLDELLITRNLATKEQKELLSAFSGAGGRFSDELNKIRKANPNDERLAYINELLKQINDKLPKASGEIVDKGLSITDFYARSGDAYFTPTHIIKSMSDLAKKMGLKDESYILEPSAGVGRFLGFFDDKHPYIHAVELDKLSANIARKLYPTAQIENAPFQNSLAARNIGSYDLIIGNPPYANVKIQDKMIHDYFMLKSIENLKENGISIQIVTHNFMDKMSSAKMQIAKNAEFLGGVRLPNDTFKDAKVTTDILVFRKLRADEIGTADTSWTKLSDFENGLKVSSYFKEQKPDNVLGELITQKGQFGDSVGVKSTGFDLENLDLSKFIKESKEAFHTEKMHLASTQLAEPQKTGNFYKENGEIFQNGQKVDLKERLKEYGIDWADSTFEKRIGDFKAQFDNIQELKNTLLDLQRLELVEDFETPKMKALRAKLNAEFNKLVGKDGSLYDKRGNARAEFSVFEILDDTSFEIFALQDAKGAKKADIFTKRINYPYKRPMSADNLNEAMQISRNEYGKYDIGRMSDLLNKSKDEVQNELLANKFIYIDSSGKNVPKDEFLSGDVKTKLERFYDENGFLKFSDDENVAKWQRQAFDDLKAVIPKDVELPLINIPLGATFLDKRILNEFLKDELGLRVDKLDYNKEFGWEFKFYGNEKPIDEFVIATSDDFATNTGIRQINALSYLNDMLNNRTLQVKRSVKQQDGSTKIYRDPIASQQLERMSRAIEQRFMDFIQNHAEFAPLALRQYNDTFNRWVARKYDGSHLEFIGKNRDIDPRPHQKNGVYRILSEAKTLLAHAVGTGKTYTMGLSAVEAKRLGMVSKPLITTPNNVAPQLAKELRKLYPNARIKLVQGVSKKTKNLQLAELKKNDYDIIVCSMTAFESMNVSPSAYKMYYDTEMKQLLDIERQLLNDPSASKKQIDGIAKRIENLDKKINDYLERVQKDGQSVFFDDIGVDMLLADEAHYFKSLPIITKQYNVRGIGSANSNRAIDAYIKIHSKPEMKVVFATGTPITNYISDIYVMQRFLGAERLKAQGMEAFDEWSKMHARTSSEFELKSTGEYKLTTRLRDFTNLPELQMAYLEFADIVTKDDMLADLLARGLKPAEPPIKYENALLERSQAQSDFMKDIIRRSNELANNPRAAQEKGGDNHLKIISDTNKASLDMRLINPSLPRDENGKIAKCAENILKVYKEFDEHKGTQLVFLDTSTPKSKKKMKAETKAKKEKELAELQAKLDEPENYSNEQLEKMTNKAEKLSEELESHDLTKFSAYEDLKELLIQKGIKEDEIAFIHDYDTEKKALELNRKINDGEIRVLLGSTKKMGAGSNFQERLAAIHNLDLDWTPANMEQRLGRIERQGNSLFENIPNFEARVFNYLTKEMSDSLMLQVLSRKQKLIKQLQKRDISLRQLVDTSEDNLFGQLQAASSPYAKQLGEIFSLQNEVSTLENALKTNQSIITSRTNYINKTHKELEKIARQKEFLNRFENTKGSVLEVGGKSFDFDDKEAIKAINDALYKELTGFGGGVQEIATLKGFKIIAKEYPYSNEIQLFLGDTLENAIAITQNIKRNEFSAFRENKTNFVQRFNNVLKTKPKEQLENAATKAKDELAKAQKVLDEYKNKDLSDEKRQLNDKLARLDELNLYVGCVDKNSPNDATLARLEARYGKKYQEIVDIVREKIDKENTDEVLDISFAPKRSDESVLSENLEKSAKITRNFFTKGHNKMSQKPQEPRFKVTKELEKAYRNAQILPKASLKTALNLDGRIVGDFIKLAQKHPEYFANPQEARDLCQAVLSTAQTAINASDKRYKLIIAPVKDERGEFGAVALRVQNLNGEHRIRSVLFMDKSQVIIKLDKAKELGEPILQF